MKTTANGPQKAAPKKATSKPRKVTTKAIEVRGTDVVQTTNIKGEEKKSMWLSPVLECRAERRLLFLGCTRLVHWQQLFVHYRLRLGTLYEDLITVERNCGVSEPVNIDAPLCGCVCR
jgi:hypothetical protein